MRRSARPLKGDSGGSTDDRRNGPSRASPFSGRTAWARSLRTPLQQFLRTETGGAAVLLGAALAALTCRSMADRGRVPGARAHRRPGAQRGRACAGRRVGARARRWLRDRRTRRAARGRARGHHCCDSRPGECGARPRLRRGCSLRLSRSRLAGSRANGIARRTRSRGSREHGPRRSGDGAASRSGTAATWRPSPATRRHPNEESRSPTSTSTPTARGLPHWARHSPTGCSHPHLGATLPLDEAATALQTAVAGRASGATVFTLPQSPENAAQAP
jgi:hypothetical protein